MNAVSSFSPNTENFLALASEHAELEQDMRDVELGHDDDDSHLDVHPDEDPALDELPDEGPEDRHLDGYWEDMHESIPEFFGGE